MSDEWRSADRPPQADDADAQGYMLVWHKYNGVMLMNWHLARNNPYALYWMPTPGKPEF